ncbi:hypothetical protein [Soonwooa sp.]|uniref:hypothetical protein n=1 Tax=Soonwooa sp. TaxID=1938592 RepID=UPI00289E6BD1|nr:hypothetical protein [Soonwooa sp.]
MKNNYLKLILISMLCLSIAVLVGCGDKTDDDLPPTITRESLRGKWIVDNVDGKLYMTVPGTPEVEVPLNTYWKGKTFYFTKDNRLYLYDGDIEVNDMGEYNVNDNKVTVTWYPGVMTVELFNDGKNMKLTNLKNDYYQMLVFYTGQSLEEIKKMYRVETDVTFNLHKQ